MKVENNELWGGFIGFVVGLLVAKVYQSWAILYRLEGSKYSNDNGWREGILSTPIYIRATEYPLGFTIVVVIIFIIMGILLAKYLTNLQKN